MVFKIFKREKKRDNGFRTVSTRFSVAEYEKMVEVCKKTGDKPYGLIKKAVRKYVTWLESQP